MRIISKNRFSKFIIRKVSLASLGNVLKIDTSNTTIDQSTKIMKPARGAASYYERRIIAGSAL